MRAAAWAIMLFTVATRLLRAGCRWEEWGLHYAAYNRPALDALHIGDFATAATTWVGLHPPLYPLLHGLGTMAVPQPLIWGAFSALCSTLAVFFILRAHPQTVLPALLLATDPVQLHYAAEVNYYPLGVLLVSAAWWAARTGKTRTLTVMLVVAGWTHIMAGAACALIAVTQPKRLRILGFAFLGLIPMLAQAWILASDAGSQRQPSVNLEATLQDAIERFSVVWVILFPMVLLGFARAREAAVVWSGTAFFWLGTVSLGLAAPHQFPYAVFLGVPAAVLLAGSASRHMGFLSLIVTAALGRGAWMAAEIGSDTLTLIQDQSVHRGIDAVMSLSLPGDAIVLVRGPGAPDDDRRHISPTLWRLSPLDVWLPLATGVRPDLVGQPMLVRGRRVYTFAHPRPAIGQVPGNHTFTVLYDGAEQNPERIPNHPKQGDWEKAGPDLWRGPALTKGSVEAGASGGEGTGGSPPDLPVTE